MESFKKKILAMFLCSLLSIIIVAANSNISFYQYDSSTGLPQMALSGIAQDNNGDMWFASTKCGLVQYNGYKSVQVSKVACYSVFSVKDTVVAGFDSMLMIHGEGCWRQLLDKTITDIVYKDGCFIFAGLDNVCFWSKKQGIFRTLKIPKSSQTSLEYIENTLYVSTIDGDLFSCRIDDESDKLKKLCHSEYQIQRLKKGRDGLLVATMGGGLKIFDTKACQLKESSWPIVSGYAQCAIYDNDGNLWVGTREGLTIIDTLGNRIADCVKESGIPTSISHNSIKTLFVDKQGGVWVGTYYGGINYYHPQRSRFHTITKGFLEFNLNDWIIGCIAEDRDGVIWIGTNTGGINSFDPKTGLVKKIVFDNELDYSRDIKAIVFRGNKVFIGTHGQGMFEYDRNSRRIVHYRTTTNVAYINFIDDYQVVYGTEENEYFLLDLRKNTYIPYDDIPQTEMGINIQGLENFTLVGQETDSYGNLWISTNNGLLHYDTTLKDYSRYTQKDGLASDYFIVHAHCRASDGTLYFGGIGGVTYFNPSDFNSKKACPIPFVREISINGMVQDDFNPNHILKISNECKQLIITFAVSDYISKGHNVFEYMLEGYDDRWWEAGIDSKAVFTKLPKGQYKLKIRAKIGDGLPSTNDNALTIRVYPPWYATTVGIILEILFAVCVVIFIIRFVLRQKSIQNELKMRRLEEQHQNEILKLKAMKILNTNINVKSNKRYDVVKEIPLEYQAFIYTLIGVIEDNIANPQLSTELLAQKLKINRVTLYKKIKAATGYSALKMIHKVRFMEACRMLQEGEFNISEICYNLGFINPSNFATAFKKEVGCTPSEYVAKNKYVAVFSKNEAVVNQ